MFLLSTERKVSALVLWLSSAVICCALPYGCNKKTSVPQSVSDHFACYIEDSWHSACHGSGALWCCFHVDCVWCVGVSHYSVCFTACKTFPKPRERKANPQPPGRNLSRHLTLPYVLSNRANKIKSRQNLNAIKAKSRTNPLVSRTVSRSSLKFLVTFSRTSNFSASHFVSAGRKHNTIPYVAS